MWSAAAVSCRRRRAGREEVQHLLERREHNPGHERGRNLHTQSLHCVLECEDVAEPVCHRVGVIEESAKYKGESNQHISHEAEEFDAPHQPGETLNEGEVVLSLNNPAVYTGGLV
jgi:hypothetical protein